MLGGLRDSHGFRAIRRVSTSFKNFQVASEGIFELCQSSYTDDSKEFHVRLNVMQGLSRRVFMGVLQGFSGFNERSEG